MQLDREYESEINLRDLFFHILYRWRSILLIALAGAVLLGGYKVFSLRKAMKAESAVRAEEQDDARAPEDAALVLEREVSSREDAEDALKAFLQGSIYIRLNPQGVWCATWKYLVRADASVWDQIPEGVSIDPTDSILPAYTYPLSGASSEELLEAFGTDQFEYAAELVESGYSTGDNTVWMTVKGTSRESVEKGLAFLRGRVEKISETAQELGKHTLVSVGGTVYLGTDTSLNNRKDTLTKALDQYHQDVEAAQQEMR